MKRTLTRRESWTPTGRLDGFTVEGLKEIVSRLPQNLQPAKMAGKNKADLLRIVRSGLENEKHNSAVRSAVDAVRRLPY